MEEFLYYAEIQQQLNKYMEEHGEPCTLCQAAWSLWKSGKVHTAEKMPIVSFAEWDIHNLDQFDSLMGRTGLPIAMFGSQLQPEYMETENSAELELLPAKKLENQAPGARALTSFDICYIMKGEATLEYNGQERVIPEGTICILSPQFAYDIFAGFGCKTLSIFLSAQTIDDTLQKMFRQDNILSEFFRMGLGGAKAGFQMFSLASEDSIRRIMRNIFDEYYSRQENFHHMCANYVEILLTEILRQCGNAVEHHSESKNRLEAPPMLAILKYIQMNYRTTSLDDTAKLFHYERSYLGKLLKGYAGKSFTDIVRELRISEAKRLLRDTDRSLEMVAEQAGYNNPVHFFREFRGAMGVTPGEYRKQKNSA